MFIVSYQYLGGLCGNQSFASIDAMDVYIRDNKVNWKSHSRYTKGVVHGITTDMVPMKD